MKPTATLIGMLAAAALLAGCADDPPTAPAAAGPSLGYQLPLPIPRVVQVATRVAPLPDGVEASAWIGPRGGTLAVPEAGLIVVVPRGAVSTSTLFAARALPGSMVAYEFEPHGATFAEPVRIQQQFAGPHAVDLSGGMSSFEGGYFPDAALLDATANQALVSELLPATVDPANHYVFFTVHHFSGYLLASGRSAE
jgi:hypothetical protein